MDLEEMKSVLEQNGYFVEKIKKPNNNIIGRQIHNEINNAIFSYIETTYGKQAYWEIYKNRVELTKYLKKVMLEKWNITSFYKIPDKDNLIQLGKEFAKNYISKHVISEAHKQNIQNNFNLKPFAKCAVKWLQKMIKRKKLKIAYDYVSK